MNATRLPDYRQAPVTTVRQTFDWGGAATVPLADAGGRILAYEVHAGRP